MHTEVAYWVFDRLPLHSAYACVEPSSTGGSTGRSASTTGRPQLTATTSASPSACRRPNPATTDADTHSRREDSTTAPAPAPPTYRHAPDAPHDCISGARAPDTASSANRPHAQDPRRARNDRQATPRTHRRTRRNHPLPLLSKLLVPPPISSRRSLPIHRHVVNLANSGGNILTARVSGGSLVQKLGYSAAGLRMHPPPQSRDLWSPAADLVVVAEPRRGGVTLLRWPVSAVAFPVFGSVVLRWVRVGVAEIPAGAGDDRLAAAGAHGEAGVDLALHAFPRLLVSPPVLLGGHRLGPSVLPAGRGGALYGRLTRVRRGRRGVVLGGLHGVAPER